MSLRALLRAVNLGWALNACLCELARMRMRGPLTLQRRAEWMHGCGLRVMRSLGLRLKVRGTPPARGLLVSNHLSYLDIVVFAAALPCCIVSKAEVSRWPLFGWMARSAGTLFVNRSSRSSAESVASQIRERLQLPLPILVFPEGTTSDGRQVLRFHSRFFEPAVEVGAPVTAAAIRYLAGDGQQEWELCWFGEEAFLPHLWKVLSGAEFVAELCFCQPKAYPDRREAAAKTQCEIMRLREVENSPTTEKRAAFAGLPVDSRREETATL